MKIWVLNQRGRLACDFVGCALLRDNVQHHLEHGVPGPRFACLHTLADLFWSQGQEFLPARAFRDELRTAWTLLDDVSGENLAVSIHTRAALRGLAEPPAICGTALQSLTDWALPTGWALPIAVAQGGTLGDLFQPVVFELFVHTLQPLEGGLVGVEYGSDSELPPVRQFFS